MISLNWYRLYERSPAAIGMLTWAATYFSDSVLCGRQRVLDVEQPVRQHGVAEHDDLGLAEVAVDLDAEVDVVADRLADHPHDLDGVGDRLRRRALLEAVEERDGPQRGVALLDELLGLPRALVRVSPPTLPKTLTLSRSLPPSSW